MTAVLARLLLLAAPALLTNARLETRTLDGPLDAAVKRAASRPEASWVGWDAPYHGDGSACCMSIGRGQRVRGGGCRLECSQTFDVSDRRERGAANVHVLLRVAAGRIDRVRAFTDDCVLDAEGRRVVWIDGVRPAQSVALLTHLLAEAARPERFADETLAALALHEAPEALTALLDLAKRHASRDVRAGALFWLAQRSGEEARAAITRAIEEDPETEVKRRAVFALSEMKGSEGVPLLIDLARRHKNPAVREQAFFWLGESEDPRALAFFEELLGR